MVVCGLASLAWLGAGCDSSDDGATATDAIASDVVPDIAVADVQVDAAPDATIDIAPDVPIDTGPALRPYPDPAAWAPNAGPGGPAVTFEEEQLTKNCAFLDGGPLDWRNHHNLVVMYDGYLLMPWAPEGGEGGLTFFDISDPCDPKEVGSGWSAHMRETHSIGFSSIGGEWAVVNHILDDSFFDGGIEFWDVSDPTAPEPVFQMPLPGFFYPDAYARVTISVFWQAPYVYVAGSDNGIYVVDATNPREPVLVTQLPFEPTLRVGQVQAIGNLLIVTAAEGARTVLLDISDPGMPQPIPGGDFEALDGDGEPREAYFTNSGGGYVYYARKSSGGGVMIMDIHDPSNPVYSGDYKSAGNGGYVFVKDELAFVGESSFAAIYDISDHSDIKQLSKFYLTGDLDTFTPIGNVGVLAVDDKAEKDKATAIAPYATEPDSRAPTVTWSWPDDGATGLALTSRVGVTFNEMVDVRSAWEGSVRLYVTGTDPALTRVDGTPSVQENILNFWPSEPLEPGTEYTFELPANGVVDYNGNALAETWSMTFTTAGDAAQ